MKKKEKGPRGWGGMERGVRRNLVAKGLARKRLDLLNLSPAGGEKKKGQEGSETKRYYRKRERGKQKRGEVKRRKELREVNFGKGGKNPIKTDLLSRNFGR